MARLKPIEWTGNSARIIDQTLLPMQLLYENVDSVEAMYQAIRVLKVRGAPLIGISAAYGVCIAAVGYCDSGGVAGLVGLVERTSGYLAQSRPTAVNLFWALKRMENKARALAAVSDDVRTVVEGLVAEAKMIHNEDIAMGRSIGEHGYKELKEYSTLQTHCNAGGLATGEFGTALAPMYRAQEKGKLFSVYADETRPLLQGSRITAFELQQAGVPVTVICDNMASSVMANGKVDAVIVGADRIAANGDAANKIGTFGLAVIARYHGVPFYVAAPFSTFDIGLDSGSSIPIEERDMDEIGNGFGRRTVPVGVPCYNPAFDVTPNELITGIITEKGVFKPPYDFRATV